MLSPFFASFLATCLFAASLLTGCSPNASLIPQNDRTPLAESAVNDAVDAYNRGDTERGDAVLNRAVILLTDSTQGDFSDEGYIAVAERLNEKGRPQDSLRLLTPLTKDRRVSWNPVLWATVARTAHLASDAKRETEAEARARTEANQILADFGGAMPAKDGAVKNAVRATCAGRYFDEYTGDYAKALQAYREAYRLMSDAESANNLGYALANRGNTPADFTEAVRLTRSAVEENPDEPVFLDAFGWALFKRGDESQNDLAGARRRLREASDHAPNSFAIHTHLAIVYEASKQLPDALQEARIAAQIKPDDGAAKARRDRLQTAVAALPSPSPSPTDTTQSRPPEP